MFDFKKPTVQMLGKFRPTLAHYHLEFFKRCVEIAQDSVYPFQRGQVIIQLQATDQPYRLGSRKLTHNFDEICKDIEMKLARVFPDLKRGVEYEIMLVPNIVNISYGRGVGYVFEEEVFEDSITNISATKIREKLRQEGELE